MVKLIVANNQISVQKYVFFFIPTSFLHFFCKKIDKEPFFDKKEPFSAHFS